MHRIHRVLVVSACLVVPAGVPASATSILVSNLVEDTRDTTAIMAGPGFWAAQSFVTDGSSYSLASIDTLLGNLVGSPGIVAELHADGGSTVGALLTTFSLSLVPTPGTGLVTLTPSVLTTLDPTTTYWIVFGVVGPGTLGWSYAEGNDTVGSGSLGAYGYSTDNGVTWGTFGTDDPYKIAVNVDPMPEVPEPGSTLLLLVGLVGLLALPRVRRRA